MWKYNDTEFTSEDIKDFIGFTYEVLDLVTNKSYCGKKKFKSIRKLPPLKGQKRKRTVILESDWKQYYGSSEEVKGIVSEFGPERFTRKILRLCKTTSEMSYYEAKYQLENDVLLKPDKFYNAFVGCRINRSHLKHLWSDYGKT